MTSRHAAIALSVCLFGFTCTSFAASPATAPADFRSRYLPELNVNGMPLGSVFEWLRDVTGDNLKVVVVYEDPSRQDYPLVTMKLNNFSVDQILEVLHQAYTFQTDWVQPAHEKDTDVLVVHIPAPPDGLPKAAPATTVHVYNLSGALERIRAKQAAKEDALNDILSLMKAALGQAGGKPGGKAEELQVHEATQTLLFKGTPEQQRAVQEVLAALDPDFAKSLQADAVHNDSFERAIKDAQREKERAQERIANLERQLKDAIDKLNEREAESMKRLDENERLKIRIESLNAAHKAKSSTTKE